MTQSGIYHPFQNVLLRNEAPLGNLGVAVSTAAKTRKETDETFQCSELEGLQEVPGGVSLFLTHNNSTLQTQPGIPHGYTCSVPELACRWGSVPNHENAQLFLQPVA